MRKIFSKLRAVFKKKPIEPPKPQRPTGEAIRVRLTQLGWTLKEMPIRRQQTIDRWRVTAMNRQGKTCDVSEKTLEDALFTIGIYLGVVSSKHDYYQKQTAN